MANIDLEIVAEALARLVAEGGERDFVISRAHGGADQGELFQVTNTPRANDEMQLEFHTLEHAELALQRLRHQWDHLATWL